MTGRCHGPLLRYEEECCGDSVAESPGSYSERKTPPRKGRMLNDSVYRTCPRGQHQDAESVRGCQLSGWVRGGRACIHERTGGGLSLADLLCLTRITVSSRLSCAAILRDVTVGRNHGGRTWPRSALFLTGAWESPVISK